MFTNIRILTMVSVLAIVALACGLPTAGTPVTDSNAISTAAAGTVAAQLTQAALLNPPPAASRTPEPAATTATNTSTPTATPFCDKAEFVSETIPDGTDFAPGATFTKSWRVRNAGACTWTATYAIVFDHGNALGAPAVVPFPGNVAPGQEVDLSINMQAPAAPGSYESYWKFRNASGVIFVVNPFWAKIDVIEPTPTPTNTPFVLFPFLPIIPLAPFTTQVMDQISIAAGEEGNAFATCAGSSIVVGGGFAAGIDMVILINSKEGNGWRASAKNNYAVSQVFNAYAVCLSMTSGATVQKKALGSAPGGGTGHMVAECPAGSVVTGGGYNSSLLLNVTRSFMSGNGWEVSAKNLSGSDQPFFAYAICLSGTSGTTTQVSSNTEISGNSTGSAQGACASGSLATGGGFALGNHLVIYNTSQADASHWVSYARSTAAGDGITISPMTGYAVCLSFP